MKNVLVCGVGALGSHVVQYLRNEAQLRIVDFDRVDSGNLASQFHSKPHTRKLKVEALQKTMQFLWGTVVTINSNKLTTQNVDIILHDHDLVIDCLDNGEGRRVIQTWVRRTNTPCLHGALAANGGFGRVCWDAAFKIDDEAAAGEPTCAEGDFLPFIAIVSAYLARAAQIFLRDQKQVGFSILPTGEVLRT